MRSVGVKLLMLLGVVALVTSSCKKEQLQLTNANEPIFRAVGDFDGNNFELIAGDNNAYMHTMSTLERGVRVFSGRLDDGDFSIEMGIYDGNVDMPLITTADEIPSSLMFSRRPTMPIAQLSKGSFSNEGLISQIEWFVDGTLTAIDDLDIIDPGVYEICAKVQFTDGTSNELCSTLIFGYDKNASCVMKHFVNQNQGLSAWIQEDGFPIEKVKWYVNGENVQGTTELNFPLESASYLVEGEVHFQNGVVRTKSMIADGSLSGKFVDDLGKFEIGTLPISRDFNVRIRVKDDGVLYSSENANNSNSTFTISSIDEYGWNTAGKLVYKVSGTINAKVADNTGANMKEISFNTQFGFEIP